MKKLLLNNFKNDVILFVSGLLSVILISVAIGKENSSEPPESVLTNPTIRSAKVIRDLGITVVEFKNGLTCVVPFNKKSISCTQKEFSNP